ncbi:MAG: hypothetical protein WKF84_04270 [Pyrinomonadaceae bacterium]
MLYAILRTPENERQAVAVNAICRGRAAGPIQLDTNFNASAKVSGHDCSALLNRARALFVLKEMPAAKELSSP